MRVALLPLHRLKRAAQLRRLRRCAVTLAATAALAATWSVRANAHGAPQRDDRAPPPASLVAAVENKAADIYSTLVLPCRKSREKDIAEERRREEGCAECQDQLPKLAIIEKQAMARCDVKGYDARIADIDARRAVVTQRLRNLVATFQRQARSNEVLSEEIKDGEAQAWATFTEAAWDKVLNWPPDQLIKRIEIAQATMKGGKNVKYATRGELGAFVAAIRSELRGKSKQQARAIVFNKLKQARLLADGIRVVNFASAQAAGRDLEKTLGAKSALSDQLLDSAYGALITSLKIAQDQSVRNVQQIVKLNPVLGYSQDTVKIGLVFANVAQLQGNVEGLSSLLQAAESQRRIAKSEIDYLVQKRRVLVAQRNQALAAAGGP